MKQKADIGLIGLAVMGENLVMNMESKGFTVAVFNRTTEKVDKFVSGRAAGKNIIGCHTLEGLVANLEKPRKVFMMVKAGQAVDDMIEQLLPLLDDGDILIDGKSITQAKGKNLRNLRRDIGMIFQSFNLVKRSSVLRNVLVGRVAYYPTWKTTFNLFSKEDKQKAYEALQKVDLADKVYARADELSGGQQQRVAIARVLMQNPKIILADEPTASLDPQTSVRVMNDLKMLNEKYGMTVVANLHSIELAQQFGERVIGIRAGQVVYDGKMKDTPKSVFTDIYNGGDGSEEAE